jgi:uncharacterized protein (DUF2147 family)
MSQRHANLGHADEPATGWKGRAYVEIQSIRFGCGRDRSFHQLSPCGSALCAVVVWLRDKDSPGNVGERVFYDMEPAGENQWRGSTFNPEDGKTYSGKMSLAGGALTTAGYVLGRLICKSFLEPL